MTNLINIFTDGGARGNPGHSAIGIYITDYDEKKLAGFGKAIGIATNNVAEYTAVIEALSWVIENKKMFSGDLKINFFLDSLLICSQITGVYKVKNANLRKLLFIVREKETSINLSIHYKHISREQNKMADFFVNQALDNHP